MKRILILLISAFIVSQGLVSLAQEDPCQSQVDALNTCRAGQTTAAPSTDAAPTADATPAADTAPPEAAQPNENAETTDNTAQSNE